MKIARASVDAHKTGKSGAVLGNRLAKSVKAAIKSTSVSGTASFEQLVELGKNNKTLDANDGSNLWNRVAKANVHCIEALLGLHQIQASSAAAGTPCFLKSWKVTATPWSASQARALRTVSQFGMPWRTTVADVVAVAAGMFIGGRCGHWPARQRGGWCARG